MLLSGPVHASGLMFVLVIITVSSFGADITCIVGLGLLHCVSTMCLARFHTLNALLAGVCCGTSPFWQAYFHATTYASIRYMSRKAVRLPTLKVCRLYQRT